MKVQSILLMAVLLGLGTLPLAGSTRNPEFADAWEWALPPRLFGQLSQDERNQIERAEKLLRDGQHAAAAVEFEKFIAEHARSPVRAHVLLLQGYSLHLARQRNTAIARYTELLDFYAESVDQAVPAYFLMGWAHRQNGNLDRAIQAWDTLVANDAYHQHPLTDRALLELAAYHAGRDDRRRAERQLNLVIELFVNAFVRPERSAVEAHNRLTRMYIEDGRYPALDALLDQAVPYVERLRDQRARVDYVYGIATRVLGALTDRRQQEFFRWFRDQQPHYERARALDDYFGKATELALRIRAEADWRRFVDRFMAFAQEQSPTTLPGVSGTLAARLMAAQRANWNVGEEWTPFIEMVLERGAALNSPGQIRLYNAVLGAIRRQELDDGIPVAVFWDTMIARLAEIYANMLNPERDNGLAGLVDRLTGAGRFDHARRVADRMEHAAHRMTKQVDIHLAAEEYSAAAELCEAIEAADTGRYAARALETRAGLYADQLRRYEEAIALYRAINDPPRTIWIIIDCYERMGKLQEAAATCDELGNFFPDLASRAAWRKAMIWHRANDRERAIAAFRAVLRQYPKSREAAQAHQMQERYGFDFGGGVVEGMD